MVDSLALVSGLSAGSDIRTSLQKVLTSKHLYNVEGSEVRRFEPADHPRCYFFKLNKFLE